MSGPFDIQARQQVLEAVYKAVKYCRRTGSPGNYKYFYAKDGNCGPGGRNSGQDGPAVDRHSVLGKEGEDVFHEHASISDGQGNHYQIDEVDGHDLRLTLKIGKTGQQVKMTLEKERLRQILEDGHRAAFERFAQQGLKKREALLVAAKDSGNAKAIHRAEEELNRWKDSHQGYLSRDADRKPSEASAPTEEATPQDIEEAKRRESKLPRTIPSEADFKASGAREIGKGTFGKVLASDGPPPHCVKYGRVSKREAKIQKAAADLGVAPQVYDSSPGAVMMEYLNNHAPLARTRRKKDAVLASIKAMRDLHEGGLAHNDTHSGNIMVDQQTGRAVIIDFGVATQSPYEALVEAVFPDYSLTQRRTMGKNGHHDRMRAMAKHLGVLEEFEDIVYDHMERFVDPDFHDLSDEFQKIERQILDDSRARKVNPARHSKFEEYLELKDRIDETTKPFTPEQAKETVKSFYRELESLFEHKGAKLENPDGQRDSREEEETPSRGRGRDGQAKGDSPGAGGSGAPGRRGRDDSGRGAGGGTPSLEDKPGRLTENARKALDMSGPIDPTLLRRLIFECVRKARSTKYERRWRGPDGKYRYKYPNKGKGKRGSRHEGDLSHRSGYLGDPSIYTVGASFAGAPDEGHYVIESVDGSNVTVYLDEDKNGKRGPSKTMTRGQFRAMLTQKHRERFEKASEEGYQRRKELVLRSQEGTPERKRALKELARWVESNMTHLSDRTNSEYLEIVKDFEASSPKANDGPKSEPEAEQVKDGTQEKSGASDQSEAELKEDPKAKRKAEKERKKAEKKRIKQLTKDLKAAQKFHGFSKRDMDLLLGRFDGAKPSAERMEIVLRYLNMPSGSGVRVLFKWAMQQAPKARLAEELAKASRMGGAPSEFFDHVTKWTRPKSKLVDRIDAISAGEREETHDTLRYEYVIWRREQRYAELLKKKKLHAPENEYERKQEAERIDRELLGHSFYAQDALDEIHLRGKSFEEAHQAILDRIDLLEKTIAHSKDNRWVSESARNDATWRLEHVKRFYAQAERLHNIKQERDKERQARGQQEQDRQQGSRQDWERQQRSRRDSRGQGDQQSQSQSRRRTARTKHLETLGLDPDATASQIKKAYREMSRKHHPDKNPGDPGAVERMKEINNAFDALGGRTMKALELAIFEAAYKAVKYCRRTGSPGNYKYFYAKDGNCGGGSAQGGEDEGHSIGHEKILGKEGEDVFHEHASISDGQGNHYQIDEVDGHDLRLTLKMGNGEEKKMMMSQDQLREVLEKGHRSAFERFAQQGLDRRKELLKSAEEVGSRKHIARARKELARWKDSHKDYLGKKDKPREQKPRKGDDKLHRSAQNALHAALGALGMKYKDEETAQLVKDYLGVTSTSEAAGEVTPEDMQSLAAKLDGLKSKNQAKEMLQRGAEERKANAESAEDSAKRAKALRRFDEMKEFYSEDDIKRMLGVDDIAKADAAEFEKLSFVLYDGAYSDEERRIFRKAVARLPHEKALGEVYNAIDFKLGSLDKDYVEEVLVKDKNSRDLAHLADQILSMKNPYDLSRKADQWRERKAQEKEREKRRRAEERKARSRAERREAKVDSTMEKAGQRLQDFTPGDGKSLRGLQSALEQFEAAIDDAKSESYVDEEKIRKAEEQLRKFKEFSQQFEEQHEQAKRQKRQERAEVKKEAEEAEKKARYESGDHGAAYEWLGVNKDATKAEIKSAFRKMAIANHPDKNPDDPEAEERYKKATRAFSVLYMDGARAAYDKHGTLRGVERAIRKANSKKAMSTDWRSHLPHRETPTW